MAILINITCVEKFYENFVVLLIALKKVKGKIDEFRNIK